MTLSITTGASRHRTRWEKAKLGTGESGRHRRMGSCLWTADIMVGEGWGCYLWCVVHHPPTPPSRCHAAGCTPCATAGHSGSLQCTGSARSPQSQHCHHHHHDHRHHCDHHHHKPLNHKWKFDILFRITCHPLFKEDQEKRRWMSQEGRQQKDKYSWQQAKICSRLNWEHTWQLWAPCRKGP